MSLTHFRQLLVVAAILSFSFPSWSQRSFNHEVFLSTARFDLLFDSDQTGLEIDADYSHAVTPQVQLNSIFGLRYLSGPGDRSSSVFTLRFGPQFNFPMQSPQNRRFFVGLNVGFFRSSATVNSRTNSDSWLAYGFRAGKRFMINERLTYAPFFQTVVIEENNDPDYEFHLVAFSYLF